MPLSFYLLFLWLIVLAVLWLVCLIRVPDERRKLLPSGLLLFLSAALLFGGDEILSHFALTWRGIPRYLMCILVWLTGLGAGIHTALAAGALFPLRKFWRRAVQAVAFLALALAMLFGTFFGGFWAASLAPGETVGVYGGVTVIECKWVWLDVSYDLYEYHGLLVRGAEPILSSYEPILTP